MKLKPEEKKPNPHRKDRSITFRMNHDDLVHLEILRRIYPDSTDSEILRAIIRYMSKKLARGVTR